MGLELRGELEIVKLFKKEWHSKLWSTGRIRSSICSGSSIR